MSYYLFPFDDVPKNSSIVLYGAGNIGKQFYDQVTETNFCKIALWLDKKADGILVKQPKTIASLKTSDYNTVIIAIESKTISSEVKTLLMNYGVPENKILHKVYLLGKQNTYSDFDDLRKNILYDFQCKINLDPVKINTLFQLAEQRNLRFSAQAAQDIIAYLFFEGKQDGFYIGTLFWAKQMGWKEIHITDIPEIKHIDFININEEENELQVLQSIDFEKCSFGLITIETTPKSESVKYIKSKGYKELLVAGSDIIFVPNNTPTKEYPKYSKEQMLVSVICLAYNHEKFIRKCLDGFVMQKTDFAFQVIVHDDASTDKTADIIREYQEKYPEIIKPVFQSENQYSKNGGNMRETICSNLCGKYTAYCEGDDYWTDKNKLQKQADFLENHPEFSMCSGGYSINNTINDKLNGLQITFDKNPLGFAYNFETVQKNWCVKTLTTMYRTNIILDFYKSFSRNFKFSRDLHLVYLALQQGQGYYFSQCLGTANIHIGGIFNGLNNFEQRKINQKVYKELWEYTKDSSLLGTIYRWTISLLEDFWRLSIEEQKELLDDLKKFKGEDL